MGRFQNIIGNELPLLVLETMMQRRYDGKRLQTMKTEHDLGHTVLCIKNYDIKSGKVSEVYKTGEDIELFLNMIVFSSNYDTPWGYVPSMGDYVILDTWIRKNCPYATKYHRFSGNLYRIFTPIVYLSETINTMEISHAYRYTLSSIFDKDVSPSLLLEDTVRELVFALAERE